MSKRKVEESDFFQRKIQPKREIIAEEEESKETNEIAHPDSLSDCEESDETVFEAGMILRVHMENFMCHTKFTVTLGRMLNFLTGANGSGKSAVVAAIQLCLGASARRSGRASSIGGLIKDGHPGPAILRIDLLNEGMDAYEPEKYGRIVTVERKITKTGSGGYALLNHNGEVVSREKRELERLLQHYNIFVDNPCCILSQEQSKSFINGAEKEKYEFFLKATSLERVKEELTQSTQMLEEAIEEHSNAVQKVTTKKDIFEKYQKDMEAMIALDTHEDEIRLCAAKLYWSDVAEATAVVNELKSKHARLNLELEQAENELLASIKKKNEGGGDATAISAALDELSSEKDSLQKQLDEINIRLKAKMKIENELKLAHNTLGDSVEENSSRIREVNKEIHEIRSAALESAHEIEKKLFEEDQNYSREIAEFEKMKQELVAESIRLKNMSDDVTHDIRSRENQKSFTLRRINDTEREVQELRSSGSDRLSLYGGQPLFQLMRTIQQNRFISKVFGPLGSYITVKDQYKNYSNAAEKVLFKILHTFVVDNIEDRNHLVSLIKSANLFSKFHVIYQSFTSRYTTATRSDPSLISIADILNVDEDIIFNVLVDQAKIDEIIVVADERESDSKTCRIEGRISFPPGVHSAVTLDGRQILYRNGNKSSEINKFPPRQLLASDTKDIVANLTQQSTQLRKEFEDFDSEIKQLQIAERNYQVKRKQIEGQIYNIGDEANKLKHKKNGVLSQLSEIQATSNSDVRLSALESELQELCEVNDAGLIKLKDAQLARQSVSDEISSIQVEKKEIDKRKRAISKKESEYESLMEEFITSSKKMTRELEKSAEKVEKLKSAIGESLEVVKKQEMDVDQKFKVAMEQTPNHLSDWDGNPLAIHSHESRTTLTKRITKLRAMVNAAREKAGLHQYTRESLLELLQQAKRDYEELYEHCRTIKKNIKTMKNVIIERSEFFDKAVKSSGKLVAKQFDMYMQKKGFSGTVLFDHKEHLLHLTTQTDNHDTNTQCNDMRQMSGGERSYTTLCLLLALGHVIECPFRLMDEYDVFLDEISREITLKTIQQYALDKEQRGRQFIILTPHNVTGVVTTDEVRVRRMPVPQRRSAIGPNQTTLNF